MASIPSDYGSGGSGITNQRGKHAGIATVLRDIADDLAALAAGNTITAATPTAIAAADPTAVAAAALGAFTDPPSAGEMATLRTLVNELRTTVIESRTLVLDLKARQAENRAVIAEIKTDAAAVSLLTVKS